MFVVSTTITIATPTCSPGWEQSLDSDTKTDTAITVRSIDRYDNLTAKSVAV
ncbi:hypothetical protein M378DRAFT_173780 [Amanita muscaria Koide BX008]|uniref:Uncharacterized protein n=1 Tax=Amanita muscaria (strain Koide BX008) TaxID=946122 RepID=A0A0C2W2C4_AMAMK|nr:hypothetical protein M378DRAFT_173780 [Amanita muscaria Koide BX008]